MLAAAGLGVLMTVHGVSTSAQEAGGGAQVPVPVVVTDVLQRQVPVMVRTVGNVKSNQNVEIRAQVDGLLIDIPVQEGQEVERGQLVAQIDDRMFRANLLQARNQVAATRARLDGVKRELERYQALADSQSVSRQLLEQQQALVDELESTLNMHEAAVQQNEVLLEYTQIHSPTEGRVGIRNVDIGNVIRSSDAQGLFSVVQLDPISVEFALPQAQLPHLQEMMSVAGANPIPVLAYSADGGTLLAEGALSLIDNRVSTDSGTIRLKAAFANADGRLWPEQSVVVALQSGMLEDARVIPSRAIQQAPDGSRVWRVRDGKAESVPVAIQYADENTTVITGLEPGDVVVTDGQSRLRAGASVAPQSAPEGDAVTMATNKSGLR